MFVLLMFVPPVQAHTDAIVLDIDETEIHIDDVEDKHQDEHHQNDSEDEKNTNHHHHCSTQSTTASYINTEIQFQFHQYSTTKESILFYKKMNSSDFLETLIEPPRFS